MTTAREALRDRLCTEIEAVHAFLAAWFRGEAARSEAAFAAELADRLAPGMVNIQPSGRVLARAELLAAIKDGHGANPAFAITITDCALRHVTDDGRLALVTYVEHQRGAKNTDPPDNRRLSSALFEIPPAPARPIWLHIHETALPG